MSRISDALRRLVLRSGIEEVFVRLRHASNYVRPFIPARIRRNFVSIGNAIPYPADYPTDDKYGLTRDNTSFLINRSDYVQWRLFYGVRDNALRLAKKYLRNGSIVLDIGSNFGAFSLRLARHSKDSGGNDVHVHAFEPNPASVKRFLQNLALNPDLAEYVTLHDIGLGRSRATMTFSMPPNNSGATRIIFETTRGGMQARVLPLDDWVTHIDCSRISFIKLIAEGSEPAILHGGWNLIRAYRPPIFMEVTPAWWNEHGYAVPDVLQQLRSIGYTFMVERFNEMRPYNDKDASPTQFNIFACQEVAFKARA